MRDELVSRILYCDDSCVVVNKIVGEAVEGAGAGMIDLPRLLADVLASDPRWPLLGKDALALPTAAHRLDVPVTGCVVFARTGAALAGLNAAFTENAVEKRYWGIVEPGNAAISENAELVHWIQFDAKRNKSIAHDKPGPGRKKAVLRYRQIGKGQHYLFFEIDLVTGRHHQIRAQFEKIGLHIKGDLKYGSRRSERAGGIRLHAQSLSFPDPQGSGKRITVQANPPLQDNLWQAFQAQVAI